MRSFSSTRQYSSILTCFQMLNEEFQCNLNYSFLCIKAPIKSSAPALNIRKAEWKTGGINSLDWCTFSLLKKKLFYSLTALLWIELHIPDSWPHVWISALSGVQTLYWILTFWWFSLLCCNSSVWVWLHTPSHCNMLQSSYVLGF